MIFTDPGGAAVALMVMIALFIVVHYTSPPKAWGDVTQSLIYHQVRLDALFRKFEDPKYCPLGSKIPTASRRTERKRQVLETCYSPSHEQSSKSRLLQSNRRIYTRAELCGWPIRI
jgi:hypothetical protein